MVSPLETLLKSELTPNKSTARPIKLKSGMLFNKVNGSRTPFRNPTLMGSSNLANHLASVWDGELHISRIGCKGTPSLCTFGNRYNLESLPQLAGSVRKWSHR
ncbi:unnamed protein product [Echinostoma caproni]|uniref:DUF4283 domain-containing protein n=1 Tax=Echinostoma caproni TaxID=27848 RepID=A0A183AFA4_9TREM|nr:unnamed protein product [Echinostoma caproni]